MPTLIAAILSALLSTTPAATATPSAIDQLARDIPPGWQRTESGIFNEWRSPDQTANFRVTPMAPEKAFQGPGAADAVKAMFKQISDVVHPNPNVTVSTVLVCNGTQKAYRSDDPMGIGSPGFMMIIPGSTSSALVNYEIRAGNKPDPAILAMLGKLCWP